MHSNVGVLLKQMLHRGEESKDGVPWGLRLREAMCLWTASLVCVSGLCLWYVSLVCVTGLCRWSVSLVCVSSLCLWSVPLLSLWSLSLLCVSGLCLFSAPKVCEPDLAIPAMAPSIGAMSTTNDVSMTTFLPASKELATARGTSVLRHACSSMPITIGTVSTTNMPAPTKLGRPAHECTTSLASWHYTEESQMDI